MIFYTADLHFGHQNVIEFDNRPFADVESMDSTLIRLWNERVKLFSILLHLIIRSV